MATLEEEIRELQMGDSTKTRGGNGGTKAEMPEVTQMRDKIEKLCAQNGKYKNKNQGIAPFVSRAGLVESTIATLTGATALTCKHARQAVHT